MTQPLGPPWKVDPDDPRAPPEDVWERMTPEERAKVIESLPSEFEVSDVCPPEGDPHFNAKVGARNALGTYFSRLGRRVYLACELPIYYPGERMFAPDVIAVLDVELRERMSWVVSSEGKGLDLALEVYVSGDRRKDLEQNGVRYARLGIPEYFVFDRGRGRLTGWRLPAPDARVYQPIVPQHGRYPSRILGLDLVVEGIRLRFFHGTAALPEADELIGKLEGMLDDLEQRARAAEEQARAAEEQARAAEERAADQERLRAIAEDKLAEALAELARLKGGPSER